MNNFGVFILTHGRADNVITIPTLRKLGYTGDIYLIIDNEDEQKEKYEKLDDVKKVIIFDKEEEMKHTDTIDNFKDHRLVVYARNKCHDIAKELKLDYFLVLDDDYTTMAFKYVDEKKFKSKDVKNADKLFESAIEFLEVSGAYTVAFAQGGDFIGGKDNKNLEKGLLRKAMNSFFCKTDRAFKFLGSTNEDVNAYVSIGNKGGLMFTITKVSVEQGKTQANKGGLTDIYLDNGTYVKSFYSVICMPSAVKVATMGNKDKRIHHQVLWEHCCPKILNEKWKK